MLDLLRSVLGLLMVSPGRLEPCLPGEASGCPLGQTREPDLRWGRLR